MKSTTPEIAWLGDITIACERISVYLKGVERNAFMANDEKQYAVYAQVIIIGEAANRFSVEYQQANSSLPWRQMIGMRNRIVHGYDSVDWNIVWEVATMQIPKLLETLQPLLPPNGE